MLAPFRRAANGVGRAPSAELVRIDCPRKNPAALDGVKFGRATLSYHHAAIGLCHDLLNRDVDFEQLVQTLFAVPCNVRRRPDAGDASRMRV